MRRSLVLSAALSAAALALAACSSGSGTANSASPTSSASSACAKGSMATLTANKLTIGTDDPAYSPYFIDNTPSNGKGFESAVAYAVAKQLGYAPSDVTWKVKHFDSVVAGNVSDVDFDINQVSITADRAKVVDFSDGYYDVNQAVVAVKGGSGASATSISALKQLKLGAQSATTSLTWINDVVQPTQTPQVYNSTNDAIHALEAKQIDAIVVDLPTAFYITAAQMNDGVIVGQAKTGGTTGDQFGLVLKKNSPLTTCVNEAITALKSSGELQSITDKWLSSSAGAPYLN